jgi:hypothetical protein
MQRMTGGWGERQVHGLGSHLRPGEKCAAPVLPRLLGRAPLQDTGGGNGGGFLDGRFVLLSASFTTSSDFSYARHSPVILQQSAFSRFYCTRRENRGMVRYLSEPVFSVCLIFSKTQAYVMCHSFSGGIFVP